MPDDVSAYVQKKVEEQFSRKLSAAVKEINYQTVNEIFSAEDLQSIINFYASEAGQKLVKKLPIFNRKLLIVYLNT